MQGCLMNRMKGRLMKILLAIMVVGSLSVSARGCELLFGWEPWPPFQYRDESGNLAGMDFDILQEVSDRMECKLVYLQIRWVAHLERLKNGSMDIAASASWSQERAEYAFYSLPYRQENVRLFMRRGEIDSLDISSISELGKKAFVLGITEGYYYGEAFEKLHAGATSPLKIESVQDNTYNLKKLTAGRIDGFLMDEIAAAHLIKRLKMSKEIEAYPMQVYSCDIHVMFSKESVSTVTVRRFNDALADFKKQQAYDAILQKYINTGAD